MDQNVDDRCEYWSDGCCHPEMIPIILADFSIETCKKCAFYKMPIKLKAIQLLKELMKLSSNAGWTLEGFVGTDEDSETRTEDQKILDDLSIKIKEVDLFLEAIGIITGESDEDSDSTRTQN